MILLKPTLLKSQWMTAEQAAIYYFLVTLPSVCENGQQKFTCSMSTIETLEKTGDTFNVLIKTIY